MSEKMQGILAVIGGIIQIILVILNTKLERDKEERKRKDDLLKSWKEVVGSGDVKRIHNFLDRVRT